MNNYPRLTTLAPLTTDKGDYSKRQVINSISNGKVIIELEVFFNSYIKVLMKNFRNLNISG